MKVEEVQTCSFRSWYKKFKKISVRSIILPIPEGFPQYVLTDGIVLPENSNHVYRNELNSSDESDSEVDWENANVEEAEPPHFPDFDEKINDAILTLGGRVFPKLNWSSPRDAAWIGLNNSCCCTSVSDIYLLLKSSDFIIHDLTNAFQHCEDYVQDEKTSNSLSLPSKEFDLVLRKWMEIDTSGEFRCFVKDNNLIGICQREPSLFFDHINASKESILHDITSFFKKNIQHQFPLRNYVFDVYRKKKDHIYLLDFNPFGIVTESILFSWAELTNGSLAGQDNDFPEFRFVDENYGVQPRPLCYHAVPRDVVDISTGEDSYKLIDLMKLKTDEQSKESSSDDDEKGNT